MLAVGLDIPFAEIAVLVVAGVDVGESFTILLNASLAFLSGVLTKEKIGVLPPLEPLPAILNFDRPLQLPCRCTVHVVPIYSYYGHIS